MDKKKNVNDEQLEKVSGGFDDYNHCDWSPTNGRIMKYHPMSQEGAANGV